MTRRKFLAVAILGISAGLAAGRARAFWHPDEGRGRELLERIRRRSVRLDPERYRTQAPWAG